MNRTFTDFGIDLRGGSGVEVLATCPECSSSRKKKNVKCLSANTEKGLWNCHHCGWSGSVFQGIRTQSDAVKRPIYTRPAYEVPEKADERLVEWFAARGIPREIVERNKISLGIAYMPQEEDRIECIQFPFMKGGEVVNIKYRGLASKCFRQASGAEKILYGLDNLVGDTAVIVEGEIDALSVQVAGISSVCSVPDGAPSPSAKEYAAKFDFLDNCKGVLDGFRRIVLAVDADEPGRKLACELSRRLGPERCLRVNWQDQCKDANDVLMRLGPSAVADAIERATPWPIAGVFEVGDLAEDVISLYLRGLPGGVATGWKTIDHHYTVKPGEITVVTGVPAHGKSTWLDALIVNLAVEHGWRFGIFSPENMPTERHIASLVEKYTGKPFRSGPPQRLTSVEVVQALEWLHRHFYMTVHGEEALTVDAILEKARGMVVRYGINGFVVDPWNEIDHSRPAALSETEYISQSLTKIRKFGRTYGVHVWVVAHPMKLRRNLDGSYPVPTPYDVSGSAHWRNKADNCICVWRDLEDDARGSDIHVQKVRFREVGRVGVVTLHWNGLNGRYEERNEGGRVDERRQAGRAAGRNGTAKAAQACAGGEAGGFVEGVGRNLALGYSDGVRDHGAEED